MVERKKVHKSKSIHAATKKRKSAPAHSKQKSLAKKTELTHKNLKMKIAEVTAEWKAKVKQIEQEVFEKARLLLEKEITKKEDARNKAIQAAVLKFERDYSRKHAKKTVARKTKASGSGKKG